MLEAVAGFLLLGYLVALVPARRCHLDIGGFRKRLWAGIADRKRWLYAVRISYVCFGWPSLVVVTVWRSSETRRTLVQLREQMRETAHTHS